MAETWLETVVKGWVDALLGMDFEPKTIEASRLFIDGEYQDDFVYPQDYMAMRAFFMSCMADREKCEDGSLWADPIWMAVAASEKGYRMGYAHAMAHKHGEENHGSEGKDA
jgi:hypothetical protein